MGIKPSSTLISNTMVCEASRLLNPRGSGEISGEQPFFYGSQRKIQLLDLMSLIECVTLYDALYTLPSAAPERQWGLEFRDFLASEGILHLLNTTSEHDSLGHRLIENIFQVGDFTIVAGSSGRIGKPIEDIQSLKEEVKRFLLLDGKYPELQIVTSGVNREYHQEFRTPPRLDASSNVGLYGGGSSSVENAESFESMAMSLVGWIEYRGSGAYEHCTSVLRDMYYIVCSEHYEIPYFPQYTRLGFARRFPNFFTPEFRRKLYSKLAKTLHCEVESLEEDIGEQVVFIPPFAAIVFDRCEHPHQLPARILEVRDEFSGLRKQFTTLESERRESTSIGERRKLRLKQADLLERASKAFDHQGKLTLEAIIRYVPEVAKPVSSPGDPSKYGADLLLKPIEWVVDWWKRRPISSLFYAAEKLKQVRNYESLIGKLFGEHVEIRQAELDWDVYLADPKADAKPVSMRASPTPSPALPKKVDLNEATLEELQKIPGIGEILANGIVAARPFKSLKELARVSGIGDRKILAISPHIRLRVDDPFARYSE